MILQTHFIFHYECDWFFFLEGKNVRSDELWAGVISTDQCHPVNTNQHKLNYNHAYPHIALARLNSAQPESPVFRFAHPQTLTYKC